MCCAHRRICLCINQRHTTDAVAHSQEMWLIHNVNSQFTSMVAPYNHIILFIMDIPFEKHCAVKGLSGFLQHQKGHLRWGIWFGYFRPGQNQEIDAQIWKG